jgi:hypothetical protein
MAKTATYSLIQSITASGSVSDVEFTSIPSTYTDLIIVCNGRTANAVSEQAITVYLNNDFSGIASFTEMRGDGSTATSSRLTAQSGFRVGYFAGASAASGALGQCIFYVMDYSNTTTFKTTLARGGTAGSSVTAGVGLWRSTVAITRVGMATFGAGNYVAGSTFKLYGIEAYK